MAPGLSAVCENLCYVVDVARHDHGFRQKPVGTCVGGVSDQIDNTIKNLLLAQEPHEVVAKLWRCTVDHAVRDSVTRRWSGRTASGARIRLKQPSHSHTAFHGRK